MKGQYCHWSTPLQIRQEFFVSCDGIKSIFLPSLLTYQAWIDKLQRQTKLRIRALRLKQTIIKRAKYLFPGRFRHALSKNNCVQINLNYRAKDFSWSILNTNIGSKRTHHLTPRATYGLGRLVFGVYCFNLTIKKLKSEQEQCVRCAGDQYRLVTRWRGILYWPRREPTTIQVLVTSSSRAVVFILIRPSDPGFEDSYRRSTHPLHSLWLLATHSFHCEQQIKDWWGRINYG